MNADDSNKLTQNDKADVVMMSATAVTGDLAFEVLAYDLGLKDYQAIDIGHIGMFYSGFLKGHWKGKEYNITYGFS